jgi:glycosyltransferase involved in cell wall biosynthesis
MKSRVAFVAHHTRANLNAWLNCPAEMWIRNGYIVDIIVPKSEVHRKFGFKEINGKVFYVCDAERNFRSQIVPFVLRALRVCRERKYDCLIGFGQRGMILAGIIGALIETPFIYQSLELERSDRLSRRLLKSLEKAFNKKAMITVIQDAKRAELLAKENGVPVSDFIIVPNSPLGLADGSKSNYLRDELGIGREKKIVLYSGSLIDAHMSVETIRSVKFWPEDFVLVMRGWTDAAYKEKLIKIAGEYETQVFLSFDVLPYDRMDLLFRSADVGLALYDYRTMDPNFRFVGQAAGKVFQYLRFGVPSVVTDLPGIRELICDGGCGVCIDSASSIGRALRAIGDNYETYRENSLRAFGKYEFSGHYQKLIDRFRLKDRRKGNIYEVATSKGGKGLWP